MFDHPKLELMPPPKVVEKGWGKELWLFNCPELCGKILEFNSGASFSGHYHRDKLEFFYVLSGRLEVEGINTEDASRYTLILDVGQVLKVPRFAIHRVTALEPSKIIEFSSHHEDADSFRVLPGFSQIVKKIS